MSYTRILESSKSSLLSLKTISKDYYLIINLLVFFFCLRLGFEKFSLIDLLFGNLF